MNVSGGQSPEHFISQRGFVNFDLLQQGGYPTDSQLSSPSVTQLGHRAGCYFGLMHATTLWVWCLCKMGPNPGLTLFGTAKSTPASLVENATATEQEDEQNDND